MRFIPRLLGDEVRRAARHFPALIITGPRRAGKTTLLRRLFPAATYRLFGLMVFGSGLLGIVVIAARPADIPVEKGRSVLV